MPEPRLERHAVADDGRGAEVEVAGVERERRERTRGSPSFHDRAIFGIDQRVGVRRSEVGGRRATVPGLLRARTGRRGTHGEASSSARPRAKHGRRALKTIPTRPMP